MLSSARLSLASICIVLAASAAAAQEPRFHVAAKGGVTVERAEDGLKGTVPAGGVTAAMRVSRAWRGEVEFWLPGYLELDRGDGRHRDLLLGISAVRLFRTEGVRPFVLAGLTLARTEDEYTYCFAERTLPDFGPVTTVVDCGEPDVVTIEHTDRAGTGIALTTGGGVEIPVGRRTHIVADVRLLLTPGAMLVRPAIGLGISF
jgi:hypothetical protein